VTENIAPTIAANIAPNSDLKPASVPRRDEDGRKSGLNHAIEMILA